MLTRQELANRLDRIAYRSTHLLGIAFRCALVVGSIWLWTTNLYFTNWSGKDPSLDDEGLLRSVFSILSIITMSYLAVEAKVEFERWVRTDPNAPILKIKTIPHSHKVKATAGQLSETKETGQISYSME